MAILPTDELVAISHLLGRYYDGLYHGDVSMLQQVFHPDARYLTASGGELLQLDMASYLPLVAARKSPEQLKEPYGYIVDSIDLAGTATAMVRMRSSMLQKHFTDFLALIKIDAKWCIISKVFHFEKQEQTEIQRGQ